MSLQVIREMHQPVGKFRVQAHLYEAGGKFLQRSSEFISCYILQGTVRYTDETTPKTFEANKGDFFKFERRLYWVEVLGNEPLEIIKVVEIPDWAL